jgi:flavin-dependent dehydrogenase
LAPARVVRASRRPRGWDLEIAFRGRLLRRQPDYVIDASGRTVAFARWQGAGSSATEKQVAIIGVASGIVEARSASARVVVEATSTGWWYFAAVAEARCVCMLVTDPRIYVRSGKNLHEWWRSELRQTAQVRLHYAEYARTDSLLVRSAQSRRLDTLHGPGWVAIGDAAMTFDPLTSQGIAKAVEQGAAATAAIGHCLKGNGKALDEYASALSSRYAEYLATRRGYYRLEQRWSDAEFWQSRQ